MGRLSFNNILPAQPEGINSARWLLLSALTVCVMVAGWSLALKATRHSSWSATSANAFNEEDLDRRLQSVASTALGERRGTIIIMDPQTGRVRAVINSKIAFEENLPPGSTIKPFTALAALRSGLIGEEARTLCREKYSREDFHTVCSHPRDLSPLNPTEAIAYSCNYYFGKVGEQLDEPTLRSTLSEFGFGKQSGVDPGREAQGRLLRNGWRSQNAIGETDSIQATPIQIIKAYSALVNGGRLFTPRIAAAKQFVPELQASLPIKGEHRRQIIKGMRGAVRYGTAETASLYSLPTYIFGKTGTATEIKGFRTQGWFVGFASDLPESKEDSEPAPEKVRIAVLVFLAKAHGSEAAQVARPIFAEYERVSETGGRRDAEMERTSARETSRNVTPPIRLPISASAVRVHLVRENITRTIPLEDYVRGVVYAEGSTEAETEALKALAVASRTYARKNLGRHAQDGYDFCSTTHCQRYRPTDPYSTFYVSSAVNEAVKATQGEVLHEAGSHIADAYFSASCGGATANITSLWGGDAPSYLKGVRDDYCATGAHHSWTDVISGAQLLKALQSDPRTDVGERLIDVSVLRHDASGRAELIAIKGDRLLTIKGWDFKIIVGRALGWSLLKSSRFTIGHSGSSVVFHGSGFGHGLGLCQEGAHAMAARGATYRRILEKYFPSTRIAKDEGFSTSADLMWAGEAHLDRSAFESERAKRVRRTLTSEDFRISYPNTTSQREIESLLNFLQSSRRALTERIAAAGIASSWPSLEIFINETTGDFVGRTGQPTWAAAATRGNRIETQPLQTLRRRRILETTLRHELVHTLIDAIARGHTPRWLAEGLAIHFGGEGRLVSRYAPRVKMSIQEIEQKLASARSEDEMKTAYAAAYSQVKRLINDEGEAGVWRRVTR